MKPLKVAIAGLGTIGRTVARSLNRGMQGLELAAAAVGVAAGLVHLREPRREALSVAHLKLNADLILHRDERKRADSRDHIHEIGADLVDELCGALESAKCVLHTPCYYIDKCPQVAVISSTQGIEILVALLAPVISPYNPNANDMDALIDPGPTGAHLFGGERLHHPLQTTEGGGSEEMEYAHAFRKRPPRSRAKMETKRSIPNRCRVSRPTSSSKG